MRKVVIRAKYKIVNLVFSEGYIVIEEYDGTRRIDGIFGLDYLVINFSSSKSFDLILFETIISIGNDTIKSTPKTTIFQSQTIYNAEFYCPDSYSLFSGTDTMYLSTIELVKDRDKVKKVLEQIEKLRPQYLKDL